ncbi:MAG: class I SAM-dependent methyltransferase [Actinomycetota bacterium]
MTFAEDGTNHSTNTHSDFVEHYESFLDAAYRSPTNGGNGRWKLVQGIADQLQDRKISTLLDCAVGTGFPALDLACHPLLPKLRIHATDADDLMLGVFADRLKTDGRTTVAQFAPPCRMQLGGDSVSALRIAWEDLSKIRRTYDYVMCRGNSLTYGNTWGGGREVSSGGAVRAHLEEMARLVKPGGYLHVDAPRRLELPEQRYERVTIGGIAISERVTNEPDCRHWTVRFDLPGGQYLVFDRYSTLLTISDVQEMLKEMGFIETDPVQLYGERPGFGVIIAKKPSSKEQSPDDDLDDGRRVNSLDNVYQSGEGDFS